MSNTYSKLVHAFEHHFTKEELVKGMFVYVRHFFITEKNFHKKYELPHYIKIKHELKSNINKLAMAQACAAVFFNEFVYRAFLNYLPENTRRVLTVLVWEHEMEISQLQKELNITIGKNEKHKYYYNTVYRTFEEYHLFAGSQKDYADVLSIPEYLAKHLQSFYPKPKGYHLEVVTKPDQTDLIYEGGAESALEEMMRLTHYYTQGKISKNKYGKILYSTANKTRKTLKLREFFGEDLKEGASVRTYFLTQLLATKGKLSPTVPTIKLIKELFQEDNLSTNLDALETLVLHLRGTGRIYSYSQHEIWDQYLSFLKKLPQDEWISINNVFKYFSIHKINLDLIEKYDFRQSLYITKTFSGKNWGSGTTYKHHYESNEFPQVFLHPTIKATFFLFASFGLLDLAYNQPKGEQHEDYYSVFDGLKYIRLTEFGAYIIGKIKNYTSKIVDSGAEVILSDTSMSIYLTEEDVGKSIMLEPFATKISSKRFLMDYTVFLKDCKTPKDIKDKIKVFKNSFGVELPPLWKQFFKDLENKSKCFQSIEEHHTFHLKDDRDLLVLLSREKTLKNLVIRAEDYHIIVKKKNLSQLRSRLKEYGYLI